MDDDKFLMIEGELKNALESYIQVCKESDLEPDEQLHDVIYDVSDGEIDMM